MEVLKRYWREQPLLTLVIGGLLVRLVSVFFSRGFGMHDDHFLVIEAAQSFVDGNDYNNWLPWNQDEPHPKGHSWFYAGIHYVLLWIMQNALGIVSPEIKMFVIRLLHSLYSLLIITLGYKITRELAGEKLARSAGLLLTFMWFFPILSVRNLVEVVCIPPLLATAWYFIRFEQDKKWTYIILAALCTGISMGIRYQTGLFAAGFGLLLLFRKQWAQAVVYGVAAFAMFFVTQASDLFIWEAPFAEFFEYVRYNIEHKTTYFNRPWHMYLGTLAGLLVPPVSIFLMFGYGYAWRKSLVVFLPAALFFVFHSYFPNKQERFILPFIPFLIILGIIGWNAWMERSGFWQKRVSWERGGWKFFWIMNTLALIFITPAYTKRSQVEAMLWLREQGDYNNMIVESSHTDGYLQPPLFYLGSWKSYWFVTRSFSAEWLRDQPVVHLPDKKANYVVFMEEVDVEARKQRFEEGYQATLELVQVIQPSYLDQFLHYVNPNNENFTVRIFKIREKNPA